MTEARTSRAARKIKGKQETLFTWLGQSERPDPIMQSGRAFLASWYVISGSGFAQAKMMGEGAMSFTMSCVSSPLVDNPRNTSAPVRASSREQSSDWENCAFVA